MVSRGLAISALLAVIPFVRGLSTTNVFFVRDLGLYFWPRHLWFWQTVRSGELPLWDPYAAGGQAAAVDALHQFFLLPVAAVRAAAPAVIGFNVWVAAPYPLLAAGMFLWLHRRHSWGVSVAASLLFVVAGPVLSSGNFPNLSWTLAFLPWILWAVDRVSDSMRVRDLALLALFVGLQGVSGEPVTSAATALLIVTYAGFANAAPRPWATAFAAGAAGFAGLLLAAIQILPMVSAASRSMRGVNVDATFWSLHPLSVLEAVAPHVFGHVYHGNIETLPWLRAVNDGREPLFYSLYLGVPLLGLAVIETSDVRRRQWRRFWWCVAAVSLVCALGEHTPVYGIAQRWVPVLNSFRFPMKYALFTVLALTVLAAGGMQTIWTAATSGHRMARPSSALALLGFIAAASGLFGIAGLISAQIVAPVWTAVGALVRIDDLPGAVAWMGSAQALWLRLSAIAAGSAFLLVLIWQQHAAARLAAVLLCGLAVVDPLISNLDLHPTIDASRLGPPEWAGISQRHPEDRVYVGGRISLQAGRYAGPPQLLDSPGLFKPPIDLGVQEAIVIYSTRFAPTPAAWKVRELISYDLPQLWPREYVQLIGVFRRASATDRLRFLQRTGHRYCYLPEPPVAVSSRATAGEPLSAPEIARPMALYECGTGGRRVYLTAAARVEPDLSRQFQLMLDPSHDPATTVLLQEGPVSATQPAGGVAAPDGSVEIVHERQSELVVRTSIPPGGAYLNVQDSYDPYWIVDVDGTRQPLLRANGVFRAVHLDAGAHEVRFRYRPLPLYVGAVVTILTGLLLAAASVSRRSLMD